MSPFTHDPVTAHRSPGCPRALTGRTSVARRAPPRPPPRPGCTSRRRRLRRVRRCASDAARQDFAEGWKGTLEVGKVADLCVLAGDSRATRERPADRRPA
ncbi:hypothetical protein FGW37_32620 [Streptomyces rectiverticillatus]|nr:hypothetical protein FGW37_32620 [Streptomyces rectiverticillatus]